MNVRNLWNLLFLELRPSIGLAFFRIWTAWTVGLHVIPSFFRLDDNYLASGLKTQNSGFFTQGVLDWVGKSPDFVVMLFVVLFYLSWFSFLIGYHTQKSGIALMLCCYYFYALNSFHIGTLSWDILLVTLFLLVCTPYPGDYFSVDALRQADPEAFRRRRPFFIQRLLQIQIAATYFFTALYKISPSGNWLTGNPMHVLMNYPHAGVTKDFLLKEWLAGEPHLCYALGVAVVVMELLLPFLLFYPRTRRSAISLGFLFHVGLLLVFDVPAIFFFLFPAQLLLFIHPKHLDGWIEERRRTSRKYAVLYDGSCGFCRASIERLKVMDLWGHLVYEPMPDVLSEVKLNMEGRQYGGFYAFRRLCFLLPMLYPLLPLVYLPGAGAVGSWAYRWVARNRYLLHRNQACVNNSCFRK